MGPEVAVGPACHRCGNRASLGPGTIRISDMFQFRFFVHLSFFFLSSCLPPLSLSFSQCSFFTRDSRISLSYSSFSFVSLPHLIFPLSLTFFPIRSLVQALFLSRSHPPLSLSRARSRSRSLFFVSTFLEQLCNRNGVFTLLSTFSSPPPSLSLFSNVYPYFAYFSPRARRASFRVSLSDLSAKKEKTRSLLDLEISAKPSELTPDEMKCVEREMRSRVERFRLVASK